MKTVKVTVKREQIEKALGEKFPIRRVSTRGVGLFSNITQAEYSCPEEFSLELPVEQIEGLGRTKRCRICGTAREVKREGKRKRYKIVEPPFIISEMSKYSTAIFSYIRDGAIIELEEVE